MQREEELFSDRGALKDLTPSERALFRKVAALTPAGERALARKVAREAVRTEFFYKGTNPHPVTLVPPVFGPSRMAAIREATRAVFRLQLTAPDLYLRNYRGFAELFLLEPYTKAWLKSPRRPPALPWQLLIRPDFGIGPRRGKMTPMVFEFNSLMLGGLYLQSAALDVVGGCVFDHLGARPRRFGVRPSGDLLVLLKRWLLDGVRKSGGLKGGGIAFLEDWPPCDGFSELPRIARYFREAGIRAEHGDPSRLRLKDGQVLLRDMPVAYVYRDFSFEDSKTMSHPRMKAFRRLWEEGRVAPGFGADFDQKGLLECFTSERFSPLFSKKEARLFKRHFPWTRVLTGRRTTCPEGKRCDLPEYAIKARERLVIKPSWGSGGDGILLGRDTKPGRWNRAVHEAVRDPGAFALQELVDNPRRPTVYLRDGEVHLRSCYSTVGSFFDGTRFGFHVRVSPKAIVNVAQGGAFTFLNVS